MAESALDPSDVEAAIEYNNIFEQIEPPEPRAFDEDDDSDEGDLGLLDGLDSSALSGTAQTSATFQASDVDNGDIPDISYPLENRHNQELNMSKFEIAIAAYTNLTGMSRDEWVSLREILTLIRDKDGNEIDDICALPTVLATLQQQFHTRLPLLPMREAEIPLRAEKMPTESKSRRAKTQAKLAHRNQNKKQNRKKRKAEPIEETPMLTTKLTLFDPVALFETLLASDISNDIYCGPAIFVDNPTEFYHGHCWSGSVRTSGGNYAHLGSQAIIFPSNWIYYQCTNSNCHYQPANEKNLKTTDLHIGRVYGVGLDMREESCTGKSKTVKALQIQDCIHQYREDERLNNLELNPGLHENELILVSETIYIPETNAWSLENVYLDYEFGECFDNPEPPKLRPNAKRQTKQDIPWPKYDVRTEPSTKDSSDRYWFARRMIVSGQKVDKNLDVHATKEVTPLCHTHPIRAELELQTYGRATFEKE